MAKKDPVRDRMNRSCIQPVSDALTRYVNEVEASHLANLAKATCIRHATTFVRWLYEDLTPRERVQT